MERLPNPDVVTLTVRMHKEETMKTLLSSTAIALLMTGGLATAAFAQDETTTEPAAEMEAPAKSEESKTTIKEAPATVTLLKTLPENSHTISEFYQEPVYDPDDNQVGDTNDLLIDESGKVTTVIIGVGGFLGVGEKNIAIPFDALELSQNKDGGTQLTLNASRGALEQAPSYSYDNEAQAWVPATETRDTSAEDDTGSDEAMTDEAPAKKPMAEDEPAKKEPAEEEPADSAKPDGDAEK